VVYVLTPILIKFLNKKNLTVPDIHKKEKPMVSRPGGPVIILAILISEFVLYLFFPSITILAIMITSFLAFIVGIIDDLKMMGGWFKPLGLTAAAIPIILLGAFDTDLVFPLFGEVHIPLLYFGIIFLMIPITGNTLNSIDILNGVVTGFTIIASITLAISLLIIQNYEVAMASLPLIFVSLAFYKYHKNPSKIFPGDSGALTFGSMYGVIAIVGNVEIIAAIALLPAIINSFLFLSSTKRIVEHREIKLKPVIITDDFRLKAITDSRAPITLFRIIVSTSPLTDKQVSSVIFKLAIFSGILAIISAFLMSVRL
jgi:UDP-N-acetylglucosamine--dolichyl-phosphate N-acetylglucosaminephosphotransferase